MFNAFKKEIQANVTHLMQSEYLFTVDINPETFYEAYLGSFPDGTDPLFRERSEHDCVACRKFIKKFGRVVAIDAQGGRHSVWDGVTTPNYAVVAEKLRELLKTTPIQQLFLSSESNIGIDHNYELIGTQYHRWEHLHCLLASRFVSQSVDADINKVTETRDLLKVGCQRITAEALDTLITLIEMGQLYRGQEFLEMIKAFKVVKQELSGLSPEMQEQHYWYRATTLPAQVARIKNMAIGTLLLDLSDGVPEEAAVTKFERVVMLPTNYRRSKPKYTQEMAITAIAKLSELGYQDSLDRRFATLADLTSQNTRYSNKDVIKTVETGVLTQMVQQAPSLKNKFHNLKEVPIDAFMHDYVKDALDIQVWLTNEHQGNMMSLIAPVNAQFPMMTKWANGYTWAYGSNTADSMKQQVKDAGGCVEGALRFSIMWNEDGRNENDLDAHAQEPRGGAHIFYPVKAQRSSMSGMLDVDIITPGHKVAVENIIWVDKDKMKDGIYKLWVNCYSDNGGSGGFKAQIECDGVIYEFEHQEDMNQGENVNVADVHLENGRFMVITHLDKRGMTANKRNIWGLQSGQFHPVSAITDSPNYWPGESCQGNMHYFFFIPGAVNPNKPNGFFNEFLKSELTPYRKFFEALGHKMQVQSDDPRQLSGLGFSSTLRNELIVKCVMMDRTEVIKVLF